MVNGFAVKGIRGFGLLASPTQGVHYRIWDRLQSDDKEYDRVNGT